MGWMELQTKECQGLPVTTRSWEDVRKVATWSPQKNVDLLTL